MSYGKVWNSDNSGVDGFVVDRTIDIQIPDDQAENIVSVGQAIEFIEKSK